MHVCGTPGDYPAPDLDDGPRFQGTLGYSIASERGCGGPGTWELHANGHQMLGSLNLMELYDGRLHFEVQTGHL